MAGPSKNEIWNEFVEGVVKAPIIAKRFYEATLAAIPAFEKVMDRMDELMREEGLTRAEAQQRVVEEVLSGGSE